MKEQVAKQTRIKLIQFLVHKVLPKLLSVPLSTLCTLG